MDKLEPDQDPSRDGDRRGGPAPDAARRRIEPGESQPAASGLDEHRSRWQQDRSGSKPVPGAAAFPPTFDSVALAERTRKSPAPCMSALALGDGQCRTAV